MVSNKQKANLNEQTSVVCGLHGSRWSSVYDIINEAQKLAECVKQA